MLLDLSWKKVCLYTCKLTHPFNVCKGFFNAIRKALRNANRFPTSAPRTLDPGAEAVAVAGSSGQERGLYLGRGVQGRQAGSEL